MWDATQRALDKQKLERESMDCAGAYDTAGFSHKVGQRERSTRCRADAMRRVSMLAKLSALRLKHWNRDWKLWDMVNLENLV